MVRGLPWWAGAGRKGEAKLPAALAPAPVLSAAQPVPGERILPAAAGAEEVAAFLARFYASQRC